MKGIWLAVGSLLSRGIIQTQEAIQFLVVVYVCDLLCDKKVKKKKPQNPPQSDKPWVRHALSGLLGDAQGQRRYQRAG